MLSLPLTMLSVAIFSAWRCTADDSFPVRDVGNPRSNCDTEVCRGTHQRDRTVGEGWSTSRSVDKTLSS